MITPDGEWRVSLRNRSIWIDFIHAVPKKISNKVYHERWSILVQMSVNGEVFFDRNLQGLSIPREAIDEAVSTLALMVSAGHVDKVFIITDEFGNYMYAYK